MTLNGGKTESFLYWSRKRQEIWPHNFIVLEVLGQIVQGLNLAYVLFICGPPDKNDFYIFLDGCKTNKYNVTANFVCQLGRVKRYPMSESCSVVSDSLWPHGLIVHVILQVRIPEWVAFPFSRGSIPTQGSNPGLLHFRQILYQLSHKGSPRVREWVAYPFSSGSSQPRNRSRVSCIAGRFFANWAIRKAKYLSYPDIWLNFILWVYLQRCFLMSLIYKSIGWIKQIVFPCVGGPHPVCWRLNRQKCWVRRILSTWLFSWWDIVLLPSDWDSHWSSHRQLSWFSDLQTWT